MKNTKKTFKFIDDFIKEKDIQGDFIINLDIKQNSVVDNFKDKINPEEVCNGTKIEIPLKWSELEKHIDIKNKYFIFKEDTSNGELYKKYNITQELCRTIGPCICSECSGIN